MIDKLEPRPGTKAALQLKINKLEKQIDAAIKINTYLSRESIARALGQSYEGERDLYEVLGYEKEPAYEHYLNIYERDGLGTRLVDAAPDETWRKHPILYTGDETPSEGNPGPLQEKFDNFCNEHKLWAAFNDLDKTCGISRYGLLFLGLPGELEKPATKGKLSYVTVHDEGNSTVDELSIVKDPKSPRFGLPEYYNVTLDDAVSLQKRVHYSRVLHYKRGRQRKGLGRTYGVPDLKNVLNRLYDLEKVVGGGSEAFWLLIHKGMALIANEGMELPQEGTEAYDKMVEKIESYMHSLTRWMPLKGMEIKDLGAEPVDSREQFDVIIEYLAGSKDIPQRILLGSERGELASNQDETTWNKKNDWRKHNEAEPGILRPFLKMGDELGFFDVPDNYKVFWPSSYQPTEAQEAATAVQWANAISIITGGYPETVFSPEEFIKTFPPKYRFVPTPEQAAEMEEDKTAPDKANQEPKNDLEELLAKLPNGKGLKKEELATIQQALHKSDTVEEEVETEE